MSKQVTPEGLVEVIHNSVGAVVITADADLSMRIRFRGKAWAIRGLLEELIEDPERCRSLVSDALSQDGAGQVEEDDTILLA